MADKPQDNREPPFWLHLLIAVAVLAIGSLAIGGALFSMMCTAAGLTLLLGILLIRAALVTRNEGWISGVIFGGIIALIGLAAMAWAMFYLAAHTIYR